MLEADDADDGLAGQLLGVEGPDQLGCAGVGVGIGGNHHGVAAGHRGDANGLAAAAAVAAVSAGTEHRFEHRQDGVGFGQLQLIRLGEHGLAGRLELLDDLFDFLELRGRGGHEKLVGRGVGFEARLGLAALAAPAALGEQPRQAAGGLAGIAFAEVVGANFARAGGFGAVERPGHGGDLLDLLAGGFDDQRAVVRGGGDDHAVVGRGPATVAPAPALPVELLQQVGQGRGRGLVELEDARLAGLSRRFGIELGDQGFQFLALVGRGRQQHRVGGRLGLETDLGRLAAARARKHLAQRGHQVGGLGVGQGDHSDRAVAGGGLDVELPAERPGALDLLRRALDEHGIAVGDGGDADLAVASPPPSASAFGQHPLQQPDEVVGLGVLELEGLGLAGQDGRFLKVVDELLDFLELGGAGRDHQLVGGRVGLETRLRLAAVAAAATVLAEQALEVAGGLADVGGLELVAADFAFLGFLFLVDVGREGGDLLGLVLGGFDQQRPVGRAGGNDDSRVGVVVSAVASPAAVGLGEQLAKDVGDG